MQSHGRPPGVFSRSLLDQRGSSVRGARSGVLRDANSGSVDARLHSRISLPFSVD
jgi:hypothetical protein